MGLGTFVGGAVAGYLAAKKLKDAENKDKPGQPKPDPKPDAQPTPASGPKPFGAADSGSSDVNPTAGSSGATKPEYYANGGLINGDRHFGKRPPK